MFTKDNKLFGDPFSESEKDLEHKSEKFQSVIAQPPATRKELWAYYLYYNGNNGMTMNNYMPSILQYLASIGGFNPATGVRGCDPNGDSKQCYVPWLNTPNGIPVASMSLYVQAIAFSIQFLLFTTFGSLADYGRWNRHILLVATIIACATQILPVVLIDDNGSHWGVMLALVIICQIAYGTTLVFYAAAFPNLSDNLPVVRRARADETLTKSETTAVVDKWRNQVSAISTAHSSLGFFIMTALLSGVSFVPWSQFNFPPDTEHTLGNAPVFWFICTVVCGSYWVLLAIPYFLTLPAGRQGRPLPKGANHLTIGWISIWEALKEIRKLRYLFLYFLSYFMFTDAVQTIGQLQGIIQNQITHFSAQQTTILSLATGVSSVIGCLGFLWFVKRFNISTKTTLLIIVTLSAVVPLWGCFGISLTNFGMRNVWELWVINIWSGLFTAPIWAWQQTLLAELVPRGKENLFFGLFGIVNKASAWIGPVVVGAIVETTGNNWKGWPFLLALFVAAGVILFFVDVDAAKMDLIEYEKEYEQAMEHKASLDRDNATAIDTEFGQSEKITKSD